MFTLRILTTLIMLFISSVEDIRTKQVNVTFILIFGTVAGLLFQSRQDLLVSLVPGIIMLTITKFVSGIGEGDAYLFIGLGAITGVEAVINTIIISFILAGIYACILRFIKGTDSKYVFPFVPFILAGYVICLVLN